MEPPVWAARAAAIAKSAYIAAEFYAARDVNDAAHRCGSESGSVCGSVMDTNRTDWQQLVRMQPQQHFYLGGYTEPLAGPNVTWLPDMTDLAECLGGRDDGWHDWSIFKGLQCVPRLALSDGCQHRCSFCGVKDVLVERSWQEVEQDCRDLLPLQFELLYINDKTFGQAQNWRLLNDVGAFFNRHDRDVNFVVQTTPAKLADPGFAAALQDLGVAVVELGVEVVSDLLLRSLRKPHTVEHCWQALENARRYGLRLKPYLLAAMPGMTRSGEIRTEQWLRAAEPCCVAVEVNTLSLYKDAKDSRRGGMSLPVLTAADSDEHSHLKSWLTAGEQRRSEAYAEELRSIIQ